MAFKATLKIGSKEYDVMACSFAFNRNVDGKGKPSSDVYGGTINISIESTEDSDLFEAMVNSKHKPFDGSITFFKTDEDASMKVLEFVKSYVVGFTESFSAFGNAPTTINVTITAEKIKMGSGEHDNEWPTS